MTRHPRERMPKEKAAPKSGFKFRRGCLKGMVFVHRTKRFRKCEKLIADCENCNPLIATRLPCFTAADCVIPAPFRRQSRWFITDGAPWPGRRRLNMRAYVLGGFVVAAAHTAMDNG